MKKEFFVAKRLNYTEAKTIIILPPEQNLKFQVVLNILSS